MRYAFKSSFDRAFKKLPHNIQLTVNYSLDTLFNSFEQKTQIPAGLGLKRIGKSYWEIRVGLKIRILFEIEKDLVTFYFVGNHDEIQRFIHQ